MRQISRVFCWEFEFTQLLCIKENWKSGQKYHFQRCDAHKFKTFLRNIIKEKYFLILTINTILLSVDKSQLSYSFFRPFSRWVVERPNIFPLHDRFDTSGISTLKSNYTPFFIPQKIKRKFKSWKCLAPFVLILRGVVQPNFRKKFGFCLNQQPCSSSPKGDWDKIPTTLKYQSFRREMT